MTHEAFDYIVVGGGSAGCVVAGELSADPSVRVLLLECGPTAEEHPETLRADGYKEAFINDAVVWDRRTVPQQGCANQRIFVGTGTGLGGSGSINAMMYLRGSAAEYAAWGIDSWRWEEVLADFERLEAVLKTSQHERNGFSEACIAAAEQVGMRRKENLNDGLMRDTLGYQSMNYWGEQRRSSYVAFIKPHLQSRSNLVVKTGARAQRLLIDDDKRAGGVVYREGGSEHAARARREIVLAAGALETPKLLMLSGVGPAAELRRHGIPVGLDLPGIGANFHDHPGVTLFFKGSRDIDCRVPTPYGFARVDPNSDLAADEADTCLVFYPASSSLREGMMRLLPAIVLQGSLYAREPLRRAIRGAVRLTFDRKWVGRKIAQTYGIVVVLGKPKSRGSVKLASDRVEDAALVDPAYFSDPRDMQTMVAGIEQARRLSRAAPLEAWGNREIFPGRLARSRPALERFVRRNALTLYHFAGTCKMGEDAMAVVDDRLRVKGIGALRVADASIIPTLPVSASNAPSMLIGLRAARFLREEALQRAVA